MSNDEKLKSIFSDLGRATLRGIRKCPKCGTFNGTRGIVCKNKKCDVIFKEVSLKRKLCSDAVKLLTGTTTQVYSVRVRDRGPDHRGFVQLPYIQTLLSTIDVDPTINLINQSAALCFVDTCQRSFDTSILKCHESEHSSSISSCTHILAAIKCVNEATPLIVRNSILSSLNVSNEIKQELWLLATETVGPLVQRVSKNIIAVKCQTSPKNPLGYLHFSFTTTKIKDKIEYKYLCGCSAGTKGPMNSIKRLDASKIDLSNNNLTKCLHYYACICAFASDSNLSEEFSYYVKQETPFFVTSNLSATVNPLNDGLPESEDVNETLVSIFNTDFIPSNNNACNIEVLTDDDVFLDVSNMVVTELESAEDSAVNIKNKQVAIIDGSMNTDILNLSDLTETYNETFPDGIDTDLIDISQLKIPSTSSIASKVVNKNVIKKTKHPLKSERNLLEFKLTEKFKTSSSKKSKKIVSNPIAQPSQCFLEWLAGVTELINETMHFQSNGKPDPLKFMISQDFFDCFRERISLGFTKKRLPNFTQMKVRREKPPFGTYTKYIWHITNVFHIKTIFETSLIPLDITRSFIKNKDGTYTLCDSNNLDVYPTNNGFIPIKPIELKTFLKVGNTSANQTEPTPFIIEWIPDILPKTKMGELILKFEFGHTG